MPLRVPLHPHPETSCGALTSIEVELVRLGPRSMSLTYRLFGHAMGIQLPKPAVRPQRVDGLWQHSCLEAFVRARGSEAYYEFNLAPSGDWAAYRFDGYRLGMQNAREVDPPQGDLTLQRGSEPTTFRARLQLERAASLPVDVPWQLGLSAVIEERNGRISYWALAHPPGKPDFHHPDCFQLELPAARPA